MTDEQLDAVLQKDKYNKKFNLIFGIILVVIILLLSQTIDHDKKEENKTTNTKVHIPESVIQEMKNLGLLYKLNPQLNEAYIVGSIWGSLPIDQKETIARTLALYCGQAKGNNLHWVNVYDHLSGKKLAKYSETWGFTVE